MYNNVYIYTCTSTCPSVGRTYHPISVTNGTEITDITYRYTVHIHTGGGGGWLECEVGEREGGSADH